MKNKVKIEFLNKSINESFARMVVSAFVSPLDPTVNEIMEIKTAISEAVTNAIVHGYADDEGIIRMECIMDDCFVSFTVSDDGVGIENIEEAKEPLFTTSPESERSGMGFTIMESFMDTVHIESSKQKGTSVTMTKTINTPCTDAYKVIETNTEQL